MHLNPSMTTVDAATEFSALLAAHRKIVFKVAATYAWSPEDRADLAQDIAMQLWVAFPGYDRSRPFTTWMYRVALNTAMTHARAESTKRRHFTTDAELVLAQAPAPADGSDETELLMLLAQVMAGLDRQSRALLLLHLESRSSGEIADILGLSVTNVTTRISRIRQRLAAQFSES